jgi:hypothetical protein
VNSADCFFHWRILVLTAGIERHCATDGLRRVRILGRMIAGALKSRAEALCSENFVANRYMQANLQSSIRRTDRI